MYWLKKNAQTMLLEENVCQIKEMQAALVLRHIFTIMKIVLTRTKMEDNAHLIKLLGLDKPVRTDKVQPKQYRKGLCVA